MKIAPSNTTLVGCKVTVTRSLRCSSCETKTFGFLIQFDCNQVEVEIVFNDALLKENVEFSGPFVPLDLFFGSSELELLSIAQIRHCRRHLQI